MSYKVSVGLGQSKSNEQMQSTYQEQSATQFAGTRKCMQEELTAAFQCIPE
jgi:hypothetical protein